VTAPWVPRVAASARAAEACIQALDWEQAQPWCNFVLLRPSVLPAGLALLKQELRPEAAPPEGVSPSELAASGTRSSYRCEYAGGGRRLRLKQFLYDWAPPAYDHPSLWISRNRPFPVGEYVGWQGHDYRQMPAASVTIDRTTVEASFLAGMFSDEEVQALCRGLQPAVPLAGAQFLQTSFAELSYQHRHPTAATVDVPVGYFDHHRRPRSLRQTAYAAAAAPALLPGHDLVPPADLGYGLDSVFVFGDPAAPQEVEYLHAQARSPGHDLRFLVTASNGAGAIRFPPSVDEQPCWSQLRKVQGRDVYHAYLDDRYGQHEAVWQRGPLTILLIVRPAVWTDTAWFLRMLEQVL
jgi:hypothetical protein